MPQHETDAMQAKMSAAAASGDKEQARRQYDEQATTALFTRLNAEVKARGEAAKAKAAALKLVAVADADVAVVAHELGISADAARTKLQEKKGDLVAALTSEVFLLGRPTVAAA